MNNKRFLFWRWKSPAIVNRQAVYHLVDEINGIVFKGSTEEKELMLISLLQPAGLIRRVFSSSEKRKEAKKRIKKMMVENQVSEAVTSAIEAAQAVAVSIAATTAAHHSVA